MATLLPIAKRALLIGFGILFCCVWVYAHFVWALICLMPNLMANDSGKASGTQHLTLFIGMITGQTLAALAGIPGGLAFFWRDKRRLTLLLFAILFVTGTLLQIATIKHFFSSMQ